MNTPRPRVVSVRKGQNFKELKGYMRSYALPEHSQPVSDPIRKGPEILRTKPGGSSVQENRDAITTEYHCTAEWHLSRMRSKYATPLYGFALRLSRKSGSLYVSQIHLAEYFGCSRRTIWAAVQELEAAGFFVRISKSRFRTIVSTVLDHVTWAKRNPGKCPTKIEMPWSVEGEVLGRELHAISGGRVKFRPEQIEYLKFNFTDEEIKQGFRRQLARGAPVDGHGFIYMKNLDWEALCSDV
jgi:biotin operon repressor